jgi:hypothetical protein
MQVRNLLGLVCLGAAMTVNSAAQQSGYPQDPRTETPPQLSEIQAEESELRTQAQQLDEEMLPENIERSLAGVGSTKPEELRETRRRALEAEKNRITARIAALEDRRIKIEAAAAVHGAAKAEVSAQILAVPPSPPNHRRHPRPKRKRNARHG